VRHVADMEFHDRVTALADRQDPLVQLRARFVIDLAMHPEVRITRKTWHRWLQDRHDA
jgi:glutamine amidotransferase PdxT